MVLADSDQVSRARSYSGATRQFQAVEYGTLTPYGLGFHRVPLAIHYATLWSHNPGDRSHRFGLFPFRSPLLRESQLLSFPVGT